MNLIDKDALVAEIRSRLHPVVVPHGKDYDDWDSGADSERLTILSFIDTLEVKEVEVDLEKELIKWHNEHFKKDGTFIGKSGFYLTNNSQMDIAKHFFELGLKAKQS